MSRHPYKIAHSPAKRGTLPVKQQSYVVSPSRQQNYARSIVPSICLLFCVFFSTEIRGQSLGLIGGLTLNTPEARFRQLGSFPSCCPDFTAGSGIGGQLGGWIERPLASRFSFLGRLLLTFDDVSFVDDEQSYVADLRDTPRVVPALFRHELTASFSSIVLEPLVTASIGGGASLLVGPRIAIGLSSTFRQTETLVEPVDFGSFVGSGRVWIDNSGDIPLTSKAATFLTGGLRARVFFGSDSSLSVAPELMYSYALSNVSQGAEWKAHSIRLSVSVGWHGSAAPVAEPPTQRNDIVANPIDVRPAPPKISVRIFGVEDDGTVIPDPVIDRRQIKVTNLHPMLGHVYFDDGSWSIPKRYIQGTARALRDTLTLSPMEALHGELAVIALRMKTRKQARLRVGGMTASTQTDKGAELARKRAESVIAKLQELGIEPERIEMISGERLFPVRRMSDTSERHLAIEENRRVEIHCNDENILAPITLGTVDVSVYPKRLRITDSVSATGLREVRTDIRIDSLTVPVERGGIASSGTGDLDLTAIIAESGSNRLNVKVSATDTSGQTGEQTVSIPIRHQDTSMRFATRSGDLLIERYGLVLFDFNTATLGPQHMFIVNLIKSRITPSTTVSVYGMTDQGGSDDYNRNLSQKRAREVAKMLGIEIMDAVGLGEDAPQFPNQLPEGRAANRTVLVELKTKVP